MRQRGGVMLHGDPLDRDWGGQGWGYQGVWGILGGLGVGASDTGRLIPVGAPVLMHPLPASPSMAPHTVRTHFLKGGDLGGAEGPHCHRWYRGGSRCPRDAL